MAFDPHLAELLRNAVGDRPHVVEKKMFGGTCLLLNGNMLCGTRDDQFMFRVGKELEEEALSRPGAEPMIQGGRKLGGLIWVDAEAALNAGLEDWLALAYQFVGALPVK